MNKAEPKEAKRLLEALGATFEQSPLRIAGLGLHRPARKGLWACTAAWSLLLGLLLVAIAFRQHWLAWLQAIDYRPWSRAMPEGLPDPTLYLSQLKNLSDDDVRAVMRDNLTRFLDIPA